MINNNGPQHSIGKGRSRVSDRADRRNRLRVRSVGTAILARASGQLEQFAIRDLSETGVRLIGNARLAETERVRVSLKLDSGTVLLIGEVVRTDPRNAQVAIAFREVSRDALRSIERAIEAMIDGVRVTSPAAVLVLHADNDVRAALERDLSRLDRAASLCATNLETMWSLHDQAANHIAIVIDGELPIDTLDALSHHLVENHPQVRRVLLFGEQLGSIEGTIASRIDAVLRSPWRIRALARAVGVDATDSSMVLFPVESDQ
jgi:hypothetical protein